MIVVFGSINLDLIFVVDVLPEAGRTQLATAFREEPGGKGANQAYAAARAGATVSMRGAVGTESSTAAALALLESAGIDLSGLRRGSLPTGRAAICTDARGQNTIVVASGANVEARSADVEDALLTPGNTLLLQMENDPAETSALILRARARGMRVILNLAPAAPLALEVLRAVDILIVNGDEAEWLGNFIGTDADAAALQRSLGITVIRTRGELGAEAAAPGSPAILLPSYPIRAIDSTAAGDCFVGVFADALERGLTMAAALQRANAAGALACTRPGSQRSAPSRVEIDEFLHRHGEEH